MLQSSAKWEENHEAARVHRVARWCGWRVDLRRCVCRAEIADSSDWNPQLFSTPRLQIASPGATVFDRTRVECVRLARRREFADRNPLKPRRPCRPPAVGG